MEDPELVSPSRGAAACADDGDPADRPRRYRAWPRRLGRPRPHARRPLRAVSGLHDSVALRPRPPLNPSRPRSLGCRRNMITQNRETRGVTALRVKSTPSMRSCESPRAMNGQTPVRKLRGPSLFERHRIHGQRHLRPRPPPRRGRRSRSAAILKAATAGIALDSQIDRTAARLDNRTGHGQQQAVPDRKYEAGLAGDRGGEWGPPVGGARTNAEQRLTTSRPASGSARRPGRS